MATMDVFLADAFTMSSLVAKVDQVPFTPGAAGKLNIFKETGIYTTSFEIEERAGTLALIPNTPRGGVPIQNSRDQRKVRLFKPVHLPIREHIMADEFQNKRAFGSQTELQMAETEVSTRMTRMSRIMDTTLEFQRISALQGIILDSDGTTVIYNLFTEFQVTQTVIDFLLGTSTTDVLSICENVRAAIQDTLGADGSEDIDVVAFVGKTFFQRLISHPNVKLTYQYYQTIQQNLNPLQQDLRYTGFKFGGITFKVYRSSVQTTPFVPVSQGTAFPVNVEDLYETFYAPADYMETANTEGRPRYVKMVPDPSGYNRFWEIEMQSNPLSMCKRPAVLISLITSN